tara:strand:+ start:1575 stop:1748 length:174 start_codon:yes stop_codon:yes gene_type:complete
MTAPPEPRRIVTLIPTGRDDVPYIAICNDGATLEYHPFVIRGDGHWIPLPPIPQGDL